MKKYMNLNFWLLFFLFVSCGKHRAPEENLQISAPPRPAPQQRIYYINNDRNESLGMVIFGDEISLKAGQQSYFRVCKDTGKCKYRIPGGSNVFEIKFSDNGFKLRKENGDLLWKIKIDETRIKVADNEEMTDAYEIKSKHGHAEITRDGQNIGNVDFGPSSSPVLVNSPGGSFMVTGQTKEMASGIFALDRIPADQRIILFTEIVNFGQ